MERLTKTFEENDEKFACVMIDEQSEFTKEQWGFLSTIFLKVR